MLKCLFKVFFCVATVIRPIIVSIVNAGAVKKEEEAIATFAKDRTKGYGVKIIWFNGN